MLASSLPCVPFRFVVDGFATSKMQYTITVANDVTALCIRSMQLRCLEAIWQDCLGRSETVDSVESKPYDAYEPVQADGFVCSHVSVRDGPWWTRKGVEKYREDPDLVDTAPEYNKPRTQEQLKKLQSRGDTEGKLVQECYLQVRPVLVENLHEVWFKMSSDHMLFHNRLNDAWAWGGALMLLAGASRIFFILVAAVIAYAFVRAGNVLLAIASVCLLLLVVGLGFIKFYRSARLTDVYGNVSLGPGSFFETVLFFNGCAMSETASAAYARLLVQLNLFPISATLPLFGSLNFGVASKLSSVAALTPALVAILKAHIFGPDGNAACQSCCPSSANTTQF